MNVNKYMRLIGAVLFVLVAGVALEGCATKEERLRSANERKLGESDEVARALIETALKDVKTLEDADKAMTSLGFLVSMETTQYERPVLSEEPSETIRYLKCTSMSGHGRADLCIVRAKVYMSESGVAELRDFERTRGTLPFKRSAAQKRQPQPEKEAAELAFAL